MKKINFLDLFCGCGGLSEYFLTDKKYNAVGFVDNDPHCINTVKHRLQKLQIRKAEELSILGDIQDSKIDNLIKNNLGNQKLDLIIGGPPCQAYSLAGRIRDKDGMKNDYRNFLFESYLRIVKKFQPKIFLIENVPGILSAAPEGTPIKDRIANDIKKIGYICSDSFDACLFDLSKFGIPQKRKRVFILGVNKNIKNYSKLLSEFYQELSNIPSTSLTVKEAIGDLPKLYPLKKNQLTPKQSHSSSKFKDHTPRFHNDRDIKIFGLLAKDIEDKKFKFTSTKNLMKLYETIVGKKSNIHKYYVLRRDEPSNLIPAHLYKDGLRHIHFDSKQARSITVREAARLQSFPDDFDFIGPKTEQYKMIGNAVPALFSRYLKDILVKFI